MRLAPVAVGELIETVSAPGQVEPVTDVAISARVSARIAEIPYEEGDRVTKGDPDADKPITPVSAEKQREALNERLESLSKEQATLEAAVGRMEQLRPR